MTNARAPGRFEHPTDGFTYKIVIGNVGKREHIHKAHSEGMDNMVTATDWTNPKTPRLPWVLDNGAFGAFVRGDVFPADTFRAACEKADQCDQPPVWVVIPDQVAAGLDSLEFSISWLDELEAYGWPLYLAVQDGITPDHLEDRGLLSEISGIFVGGTLRWKRRSAPFWIGWAHDQGLPVHIGRCGAVPWMLWAHRVGADSIDSSSWTRNDRMDIIDQARRAIREQTYLEVA